MKITLKNVKHSKFASHETYCFEATIYVDDKKAGTVFNDGQGGPHNVHPRTLEVLLMEHAKTLPERTVKFEGVEPFTFQPSYESLIDDALNAHLCAKDLKRLLSTQIVYLKGGALMAAKFRTTAYLKAWVANPNRNALEGVDNDKVLNLLPFDEALALYLPVAQGE
jgi:hypothetical protein